MGHLSHHKSTPDQVASGWPSVWLAPKCVNFLFSNNYTVDTSCLTFHWNRKQLFLESWRKHAFSHFLEDWLCDIFSLQIHKIWCPNKIVLFFQDILKYFQNHRWVFLGDIWQYKAVSWQNARGENKTVCRAHLHPRGLPKETRGELYSTAATCPHTGVQKKRVGGASNSAHGRLVCFGPKETGFIPGHPRSERPRLNMGLWTWPLIKLVFRNVGKCSWTQITGSIRWPCLCVAAMCTYSRREQTLAWDQEARCIWICDLEETGNTGAEGMVLLQRGMEAGGGRGLFPWKREVSLREGNWGASRWRD